MFSITAPKRKRLHARDPLALTVLLKLCLELVVLDSLLHALDERDPVLVRDGVRNSPVVLDRVQRVARVERVVVRPLTAHRRVSAPVKVEDDEPLHLRPRPWPVEVLEQRVGRGTVHRLRRRDERRRRVERVVRVGGERRVQLLDAVGAGEVDHGRDPVLLLERDASRRAKLLEERGEGGVDRCDIHAVCSTSAGISSQRHGASGDSRAATHSTRQRQRS